MLTESRFTAPSPWCPQPKWWHSEDSEATEDEVTALVAAFVRALQPEVVIETGIWSATTTEAIGQALKANGHGHLHAVEILPDRAEAARQRCAGLPVTVTCGDSLTWDPPSPIDFAWIDAHLETRHQEILRWQHLFSPGAVIGVHDTGPQHPVRDHLWPLFVTGVLASGLDLHTPRGVMFAQTAPRKVA